MKRVLVTGSSRGIGKAIVERLRSDGFDVVTHAVRSPDADLHFVGEHRRPPVVDRNADHGRNEPLALNLRVTAAERV